MTEIHILLFASLHLLTLAKTLKRQLPLLIKESKIIEICVTGLRDLSRSELVSVLQMEDLSFLGSACS